MNVKFDINLTKSQQEAYDLVHRQDKRNFVFAWSRQSGKSTLMELLCIEWLLSPGVSKIAYVCRSYLLARKVYKELLSFLPRGTYDTANGSDLVINRGRSSLQFYSAESGSALRGNTFTHLILDEFAFFKFEQTDGTHLWHDILSPTVKVKGQKVIFVSTPLGKDNLFYEFLLRGKDPAWGTWAYMQKTVYDDGLVSEEQIEEIKASIPSLSFRQEYLVEFLDDSITFFKGFESCLDEEVYVDDGKVAIGIDFSASGEDRTVITKVNSQGRVWQKTVEGSLDMRYRELASIISSTKGLRKCLMERNGIGEPMGNEVLKLLDSRSRRLTDWFQTSNSSKDDIISSLAVAIADGRVHYNDRALYDELRAFRCSWSKTGKPIYQGSGSHDDRVMSLAIAWKASSYRGEGATVAFARAKNTLIN